MFKKETGFTLFELLTVIGIIGILSAVVIPNFVAWRNNSNIRGAAFNLKTDLEMAKGRAIRGTGGAGNIAVAFNGMRYEVFVDANANYVNDGGETLIVRRDLNGVDLTPVFAGAPANATGFNNRGQVLQVAGVTKTGRIEMRLGPRLITVNVNTVGLISIDM